MGLLKVRLRGVAGPKKATSPDDTLSRVSQVTVELTHFYLQSEDKIKAIPSLYGPLMVLNHMVQQDYFPKTLVPLLLAFVTK